MNGTQVSDRRRCSAPTSVGAPHSLERIALRRRLNGNGPQLGKFADDRLAAEATEPTRFNSAEPQLRLALHGRAIDVAHAAGRCSSTAVRQVADLVFALVSL